MSERELLDISHENPILLFDGECILCNGVVQWSWRHDTKKIIKYATLQSRADQEDNPLYSDLDTVVLLKNGERYTRSDAVLQLLRSLGGVWSVFGVFRFIPKILRDGIYKWIAQNRYRWFGKEESCMLPPVGWADRFIS